MQSHAMPRFYLALLCHATLDYAKLLRELEISSVYTALDKGKRLLISVSLPCSHSNAILCDQKTLPFSTHRTAIVGETSRDLA